MHAKRNRVGFSSSTQQRFLLRRIAGAYLDMVGALKCRPEPRAMWDNVARGANAAHPKGYDAAMAGQIAMHAAIAEGNAEVIEETARRVAHYFDELRAVALAPYLERAHATDVNDALVTASKEGHEALHALTDVATHRGCRSRIEQALRELREFMAASRTLERGFALQTLRAAAPRTHATGARP